MDQVSVKWKSKFEAVKINSKLDICDKKDILFVFVDGLSSLRFVSFAVLVSEQVTFASLQGRFWIFRTYCPNWIC